MKLNVKKSSNVTLKGGGGLHNSIVSRQGESRYVVHLFLNSKFKIPENTPLIHHQHIQIHSKNAHPNNQKIKYYTYLHAHLHTYPTTPTLKHCI